jgi:hypothetical protein
MSFSAAIEPNLARDPLAGNGRAAVAERAADGEPKEERERSHALAGLGEIGRSAEMSFTRRSRRLATGKPACRALPGRLFPKTLPKRPSAKITIEAGKRNPPPIAGLFVDGRSRTRTWDLFLIRALRHIALHRRG